MKRSALPLVWGLRGRVRRWAPWTLAGASAQFASEAPPNAPSRRLRDELGPLLAAGVALLGDASAAEDDAALRAAVQGLDKLAGRLDDFIEAHR